MSPIPSGDCSPSRRKSCNGIKRSVHVAVLVREQPFPLWSDIYSVVFRKRGEFYAVGRIKASCSLQVRLTCQMFTIYLNFRFGEQKDVDVKTLFCF